MTHMHNPPHPGETLREDVLPALGLTITEAARQLGVTRAALSRVLNGKSALSVQMALRLENWLGIVCRAYRSKRQAPRNTERTADPFVMVSYDPMTRTIYALDAGNSLALLDAVLQIERTIKK
ncbi:MAG: HigA family addiction module antitoxin [Methylobacter sp.]|nr:HigA family addiction module antitoxin [Methylobacter sp.]MDP2100780.1 HigA family addiction module antitoxin [Methylobacter sp.]MDP2427051.1 HigA family addiction module antitoxin [Methylobacter sp.]MDP3053029.1 HigA family addiction module antitoxin [Methylobacter sp.]MDP3362896.1 HigA family addiction module antitoxin [Methylobacter sp.]